MSEAKEKDDFLKIITQVSLSGSHPIERAAGNRYSWRVFRKFQKDFVTSNNCIHETLMNDSCSRWYRVGCVVEGKRKWKVVRYPLYNRVYVKCIMLCLRHWKFYANMLFIYWRRRKWWKFPNNILSRWILLATVRFVLFYNFEQLHVHLVLFEQPHSVLFWFCRYRVGHTGTGTSEVQLGRIGSVRIGRVEGLSKLNPRKKIWGSGLIQPEL